MRIGNYQFKPKWFPAVLTLVLLIILARLGFWQLDRAEEKRNILFNQQQKLKLPVITVTDLETDTEKLKFRRVQIKGIFDPRYQMFIDNKIHHGKPGYLVVTPFKVNNSDTYVLVNRGWVPMNLDRKILPNIESPKTIVSISGQVKIDPRDVADFGSGNRSNQGWPAVVRWVDITAFSNETKFKVQPFLLLLSKDQEHGFIREWKFVTLPPEKSTSYAMTWFSLAFVLLIIFFGVNTQKVKSSENQDE